MNSNLAGLSEEFGLNSNSGTGTLSVAGLRMSIVTAQGAAIYPPVIPLNGVQVDVKAPVGEPELAVARGEAQYSLRTVDVDGQPYRVYATADNPRGPDRLGGAPGLGHRGR